MNPEKAREWYDIANQDLKVAIELYKKEYYTHAAYHLHQSAEKFLKSILVFHNRPVPKTHDLELLVKRCIETDKSLEELKDLEIGRITWFHLLRYPPVESVQKKEIEEAIKLVELLKEIVGEKIG